MNSLIIFGNCIAEQIYHQTKSLPYLNSQYEFLYVNSYKLEENEAYEAMRPKVKNCRILLEQICLESQKGPNNPYFPDKDLLPNDCVIVRFPALRCPIFWPLNVKDPRNRPEPGIPNGLFPFGDRLVVSLMRKGLSAKEILESYGDTDFSKFAGLDRMLELMTSQYKMLDQECDISFTKEILEGFMKDHVFLDHIHPSPEYFQKFVIKIFKDTGLDLSLPSGKGMSLEEHIKFNIFKAKPFDHFHLPINPAIGRHFNIPWLKEDKRYNYPHLGRVTFQDYLEAYVHYSPSKKDDN